MTVFEIFQSNRLMMLVNHFYLGNDEELMKFFFLYFSLSILTSSILFIGAFDLFGAERKRNFAKSEFFHSEVK